MVIFFFFFYLVSNTDIYSCFIYILCVCVTLIKVCNNQGIIVLMCYWYLIFAGFIYIYIYIILWPTLQ